MLCLPWSPPGGEGNGGFFPYSRLRGMVNYHIAEIKKPWWGAAPHGERMLRQGGFGECHSTYVGQLLGTACS